MLTKTDEDLIRHIVEDVVDEKLEKKLKHLPTKDDFYQMMDKLMTELKGSREEQTVLSGQVSENRDRIEHVEKHLHITP